MWIKLDPLHTIVGYPTRRLHPDRHSHQDWYCQRITGEAGQRVPIPIRNNSTLRLLLLADLSGLVLFWVVVVVLRVITPRYSVVSDYISRIGAVNAPYAIVQRASFVVFSWSVLTFIFGLARGTHLY
ncbi:DUF998 domain-containing protein [Halomarina pelagica]|uniref:DUF998 domain-containing protein n=1 Tax=Halomarina pelagica TaxID=2961599 RepID=UPI0034A4E314